MAGAIRATRRKRIFISNELHSQAQRFRPFSSTVSAPLSISFRSHCREVESPVAIGLGDAGPVAQSVGMDAMAVGEKRIDLPAADFLLRIVVVLENDPDGINVVDFLKRHVFCLHLVENGVCALHPCLDFIFESRFVELFANGLDKFLHDFSR